VGLVVGAFAVLVVNSLTWRERASEHLLHDEPVFAHVAIFVSIWVLWLINHPVFLAIQKTVWASPLWLDTDTHLM
jgi:hypothetical protein